MFPSLGVPFGQPLDSFGHKDGFQIPFCYLSRTLSCSSPIFTSTPSRSLVSDQPRNPLASQQRCNFEGHRFGSGVLFGPFCGPQTHRGISSGPRPIITQPVPETMPVQNGDSLFVPFSYTAQRLGSFPGSEGRILSHFDTPSQEEISAFCVGGRGIPIQRAPVWSLSSPLDFYKSSQGVSDSSPLSRSSPSCLFRRLESPSTVKQSVQSPADSSYRSCSESRLLHQLPEVRADSVSDFHLSRYRVRHGQFHSKSKAGENRKTLPVHSVSSSVASSFSSPTAQASGVHGVSCEHSSVGQSTQASSTERSLIQISGPDCLQQLSSVGSLVSVSNSTMARCSLVVPVGPDQATGPDGLSSDGRISSWMGCSHGQPLCVRSLDDGRGKSPHKHFGVRGNLQSSATLSTSVFMQLGHDQRRQYNQSGVHPQPRGYAFGRTLPSGREDLVVGLSSPLVSVGHLRSGQTEHSCGSTQSCFSTSPYRVDSSCQSTEQTVVSLGHSSSGPFRHKVQQPTSSLCVSSTRSDGASDRCIFHRLDREVSLRLSPNKPDSKSIGKGGARKAKDDPRRPLLASQTLVSSSHEPCRGSFSSSVSCARRSHPTSVRDSSLQPRDFELDRFQVISRSLKKKGLSTAAIDTILAARRPSTNNLYSSRWKSWVRFCKDKGFDPIHPSDVNFISFLVHLRSSKRLGAQALAGYKFAICNTVATARGVSNPSAFRSTLVTKFIEGVKAQSATTASRFPKWDLTLVLKYLREVAEPINSITFKLLSQKTAFLLSLAMCSRVSTVHAISGLQGHFVLTRFL